MTEPLVTVNNLTKHYGRQKGIEGMSFTLRKGEVLGFIGPNGAGKTTTIRSLLALIHPDSGSAEIFGLDSQTESARIARRTGYIPTEAFYYDRMNVRELLKYAADLYGAGSDGRTEELCGRLKLNMKLKLSDLSTGNKKKVSIVAALQHNPELLVMDEPTNGLDPLIQEEFFRILGEEKARGVTILFSSHVLSHVRRISDRVLIVKDGKVLREHGMDELKKTSYRKVTLNSAREIPAGYFDFDGISECRIDGTEADFLYKGDIAGLVKKIDKLEVWDLTIEEPRLEDIFMHYYA